MVWNQYFNQINFREINLHEFRKFLPFSRKFVSQIFSKSEFAKVYLAKFFWFVSSRKFIQLYSCKKFDQNMMKFLEAVYFALTYLRAWIWHFYWFQRWKQLVKLIRVIPYLFSWSKRYSMNKISWLAKLYLGVFFIFLHSRKFISGNFFDLSIRESLSKKFREFSASRKFISRKFIRLK